MIQKKCTKCGIEKDAILENFYRCPRTKSGLKSVCRCCYGKYYIDNSDRIKRNVKKNRIENKDKIKVYSKKYYLKNKEKMDKKNKVWAKNNRDKIYQHKQKWKMNNPEKDSKSKQKYNRKRRMTYSGKLNDRMCTAIGLALRTNKNGKSWESIVGYTCHDLKKHLENLFIKSMNWENMGEWHIDHIIPKSLFKYETPEDEEFKRCWALSNLQPLWAKDNMQKGNRLLGAVA